MNHLERLLSNGYNANDIIDLTSLFEQQIEQFLLKQSDMDESEIAKEIHRLKGACGLLFLDEQVTQLTNLTSAVKNLNWNDGYRKQLVGIVKDISSELVNLKAQVIGD